MNPPFVLRNLTVLEARARMLAQIGALEPEQVRLDQALGRTLAEPIHALRSQPPFDASAMDGWAVRRADAKPGARLRIVGESAAGKPYPRSMGPQEAVRIFTGAPAPDGADQVVIQEEAQREGDVVVLSMTPSPQPGHIRPRGGDLAQGVRILTAGQILNPWRIALAAAGGAQTVSVRRRPKVAILVNGEELAAPGATPEPWQIFDSAGPGLAALVDAWGAEARRLPPARDDAAAIAAALRDVQADLIVVIGGASVGDHDLVKPALSQLGLALAVETVKVRPGKPTWFGALADGRRVLGLPGNPASAFVCAQLFLQPLIRAMLGQAPGPDLTPAALAHRLAANGPREHWMRCTVSVAPDGRLLASPFRDQDSSLVSVFAAANALLCRPADAGPLDAGEGVEVLLLAQALQQPDFPLRVQGGDEG
jgi:molybdopterin molybdotransferase